MGDYSGLGDLVRQIREASANIQTVVNANKGRLDAIEASVNEWFRKTQLAATWSRTTRFRSAKARSKCAGSSTRSTFMTIETTEYNPPAAYIDEAIAARRGFRALIRHGLA